MNRKPFFQLSTFRRRAFGAVLLALPWASAVEIVPAQAQTAPALPAKVGPKPLSPADKAKVEKILAIAHFEAVCKMEVTLKLENAPVEEAVKRIQAALPEGDVPVEVRGALPTPVNFQWNDIRAGDALQAVAERVGCRFYVLSSGLLLAPAAQLTGAEKLEVAQHGSGEWIDDLEAGGHRWSSNLAGQSLLARAIAQEVTGSDARPLPPLKLKTTFEMFSTDSQTILQQLATWQSNTTSKTSPNARPWVLHFGSPVEVDTTQPEDVTIRLVPAKPDVNQGAISMSISLREMPVPQSNVYIREVFVNAQ